MPKRIFNCLFFFYRSSRKSSFLDLLWFYLSLIPHFSFTCAIYKFETLNPYLSKTYYFMLL